MLQRLGLPDEAVTTVPWADLDRDVEPDHLTWLYVTPALAAPVGPRARPVPRSCGRCGRVPVGSPADHASLTRYAVEEMYELVEAIGALDRSGGRRRVSSRSSATCCSRCCSTPPSPSRRAASAWPTWPPGSATRWCGAIRTCSARSRRRRPGRAQLGGHQGGREGAAPAPPSTGIPGELPRSATPPSCGQGVEGRLRLGRLDGPSTRWPRSRRGRGRGSRIGEALTGELGDLLLRHRQRGPPSRRRSRSGAAVARRSSVVGSRPARRWPGRGHRHPHAGLPVLDALGRGQGHRSGPPYLIADASLPSAAATEDPTMARAGVTIDDVREVALTLPRSYEVLVRDRVKFRVGRIIDAHLAFSCDETLMGLPRSRRRERPARSSPRPDLPAADRSDLRYH